MSSKPQPYAPSPIVVLPCNHTQVCTAEVEFLGIEEDMQGHDVLTYECPACGATHKSLVYGR